MKHIISSQQFTRANLEYIIEESRQMENLLTHQSSALFDKKIMATLFYEPSTRTRLSFETAMHRLGGKVISETNTIASSQSK
jgi:aspartate carbamoyltransferase catalytic subunit